MLLRSLQRALFSILTQLEVLQRKPLYRISVTIAHQHIQHHQARLARLEPSPGAWLQSVLVWLEPAPPKSPPQNKRPERCKILESAGTLLPSCYAEAPALLSRHKS